MGRWVLAELRQQKIADPARVSGWSGIRPLALGFMLAKFELLQLLTPSPQNMTDSSGSEDSDTGH